MIISPFCASACFRCPRLMSPRYPRHHKNAQRQYYILRGSYAVLSIRVSYHLLIHVTKPTHNQPSSRPSPHERTAPTHHIIHALHQRPIRKDPILLDVSLLHTSSFQTTQDVTHSIATMVANRSDLFSGLDLLLEAAECHITNMATPPCNKRGPSYHHLRPLHQVK